jgi:ketopantoate reductase
MNIAIIGSGNIAHALVACINKKEVDNIFLLTSNSFSSNTIKTNVESCKGKIDIISTKPEEIIPNSDLIIFTVPANVRKNSIKEIASFIKENSIVGAFPGVAGFNEEVEELITKEINIFASQRVPYIARIQEKGSFVNVDKKSEIHIAVKYEQKQIKDLLENLLEIKVNILNDFLEVNLSNSNPILHSARLYDILENEILCEKEICFYREWTDNASKVLLSMDSEFMQIVEKLGLNIKSLQNHYEVKNYSEMTKKIKSIESFKSIKTPIKKVKDSYMIDTNSRYFTEDIDKSLYYIKYYANRLNISTPNIDKVFNKLKITMENNENKNF